MVEATEHSEAALVLMPIQARHWLLADLTSIQLFDRADDTVGLATLVLQLTLFGIFIFVYIDRSITTLGSKDIPVLRNMLHTPNGGLMGIFFHVGKALLVVQLVKAFTVRRSKTWKLPSSVVATILFYMMSLRSNSIPQIPFFKFYSQISWFWRRSKILRSPLS